MILTLNGINDSARHTTDRMADALEGMGHDVLRLRYTPVRWFMARLRSAQYRTANKLIDQVLLHQGANAPQDDPVEPIDIVAHSHGCLLASRMMEQGMRFRYVWLFSPAMDEDWIWGRWAFERMTVMYNPHDSAIWWALMAPWDHPWGGMGRHGFRGLDGRVRSIEDDHDIPGRPDHSFWFRDRLRHYAEAIDADLTARK